MRLKKEKRKELNENKTTGKKFSFMQTPRIAANDPAKVPDIVRTKSQIFNSLWIFFSCIFYLLYFVAYLFSILCFLPFIPLTHDSMLHILKLVCWAPKP